MTGKNIIITGGNAGIGFGTSFALAKQGANIYIVSRSKEKAERAVEEIVAGTGNKNVRFFLADLSSHKSIRNLASEIKNEMDTVDVLLNNAGATFSDFTLSEDGLEMTIATNHFAYFLLTNLLLEEIKKSGNGRIVNVASTAHYQGKIDFETFTQPRGYFILKAYSQSKLANVLFTKELSERLRDTSVIVNCLHPGFVKTHIGNKNTFWYSGLLWSLATIGAISTEDGAKTSVYLASSAHIKDITGRYFEKCKQKEPLPLALNEELRKELWARSEEFCLLR